MGPGRTQQSDAEKDEVCSGGGGHPRRLAGPLRQQAMKVRDAREVGEPEQADQRRGGRADVAGDSQGHRGCKQLGPQFAR